MNSLTKSIPISLPISLNKYVQKRALATHRKSPGDYIESLVEKDMAEQKDRQKAEQKLEQLLLDGVNSGPATRMTTKRWEKFWIDIETKISERKKKKT